MNNQKILLVAKCLNCDCEIKDFDDMGEYQGGIYCSDCTEELFSVCSDCGELEETDKTICVEGDKLICESCIDDYGFCCKCSEYHKEQDGDTYNNKFYCSNCFNEYLFRCEDCDRVEHQDQRNWINDREICEDCYNDNYFRCEDCDNSYNFDDHITINNRYYCVDCAEDREREQQEEREEELINIKFPISETYNINPYKRYIGIEIESLHKDTEEYFRLRNAIKGFNIVDDCSLNSDGEQGKEIVTEPLNGDSLYNKIDEICTYLKGYNFFVNKNCGLHIHIDSRDLKESDLKKIFFVYKNFENVLYNMVSPSRRNNQYCKKLKFFDKTKLNDSVAKLLYNREIRFSTERYNSNRYYFLNMNSFFYRRTIEIRLHNGTIDSEKIKNWIAINLKLFEFALKTDLKRLYTLKDNKKTFFNILRDKKLIAYCKDRIKKFKDKPQYKRIENIKIKIGDTTKDFNSAILEPINALEIASFWSC